MKLRSLIRPRLAIGAGLAEWASEHGSETNMPARPAIPWARLPLALLVGLMDAWSDLCWLLLRSCFRVEDTGVVHVKERAIAVATGCLAGLLFVAWQMYGVWNYHAGLSQGMAAREKAYWSRHR